jgi:hypothetical protein
MGRTIVGRAIKGSDDSVLGSFTVLMNQVRLWLRREQLRRDVACPVQNSDDGYDIALHTKENHVIARRQAAQSATQFAPEPELRRSSTQRLGRFNDFVGNPLRNHITSGMTKVVYNFPQIRPGCGGKNDAISHGFFGRANISRISA